MTALFVDRSSSSYDWEFRYTGRREDLETGLLFFRARFYSAQLGRFISRDPLGFVDGMSLYRAYFVPDGVDPSGLFIRILQDGPLGPISSSWPAVYPGAVKPATEKPKPPVKNVQVCCAGIDLIPGPIKEQAEALGGVHCWLRTPKKAGGLYAHPNDQTADGGLPASPCYGTETVIWDHQNPTDWAEEYKTECVEVPNCSAACVESLLVFGTNMGEWSPTYQCQAFVSEIFVQNVVASENAPSGQIDR